MRHLPKHLRPRWRYLAVELEGWPDAECSRRDLQRELWFAGRGLLGDSGSADADLTVLDASFEGGVGTAVVRTRRETVREARAAVACVHEVNGRPVRTAVTGVSGTVRACEEKYLRRPAEVRDTNVVFDDADRRATARNGLFDVRTDGSYTGATRLDIE